MTAETTADFLDRLGMDGVKWAHEFKLTAEKLGHTDMDEGWLIGWFCNAIMAGYDEARRRYEPSTSQDAGQLVYEPYPGAFDHILGPEVGK